MKSATRTTRASRSRLTDMKLLITGGCGFIGSNVIRYLIQHHPDWQITNLDRLTYAANPASLADIEKHPNYRLIVGGIEDSEITRTAVKECDAVINLAAETHVDRSILDPAPFIRTNVLGTQVLLDAARQAGIPRFLHISTDEVYGSLQPDEPPATETSPLKPRSPYAASKAAADLLILAAYHTHKLPVIILRPSNNYGPYQFPEKLIPLAITNLLEGKKVPLYGRGENIRDWVYVEDTCRAIETVLFKGTPGEIYNAGGGCERRNIDLLKSLLNIMGKDESMLEFVPDRPGHDLRYALNNTTINRLGWQPLTPLDTGLARTVRWYVDNPDWWQPLKRRLSRESKGFWT